MMKYGVIMVKGDDIKVLETCATREGVIVAKQIQREKHRGEDAHVAAVEGVFDDNGNLTDRNFKILY